MLTRLALLNACACPHAVLRFDDVTSFQLVGRNNVGKSSLIHALNFLFLPPGRREFSGGRKQTSLKTLRYYFPQALGSYLAFEFRSTGGRTQTLICWRSNDDKESWGLLDRAYDDDLFFEDSELSLDLQEDRVSAKPAVRRLRTLTELKGDFVAAGYRFDTYPDRSKLPNVIYSSQAVDHPVVKLKKGIKAKKIEQLYAYLLNTNRITASALKEMVLVADGMTKRPLAYRDEDLQDIERIRRERALLTQLEAVREQFETFRSDLREHLAHERLAHEQQRTHGNQLRFWRKLNSDHRARQQVLLPERETSLKAAEAERDALFRKEGQVESELSQKQEMLTQLDARLKDLSQHSLSLLEQQVFNLQAEVDQLKFKRTSLERDGRSVDQLKRALQTLVTEINRFQNNIDNQDSWLVNRLSPKLALRAQTLLHEELAHSADARFSKAPTQLDSPLAFGDGIIEVPAGFGESRPPKTIDNLREELATKTHERTQLQSLLETAEQLANLRAALATAETKLASTTQTLSQVRQLPTLTTERQSIAGEITALTAAQTRNQADIKRLGLDVQSRRAALTTLSAEVNELARVGEQLRQLLLDVERWLPLDADDETRALAGEIAAKLPPLYAVEAQHQRLAATRSDLIRATDRLHREAKDLCQATAAETDAPEALVEELTERFAAAEDQRSAYTDNEDALVKRLAAPAGNLLEDYDRFSGYVTAKFNRKLRNIQVSDLEDLHLELEPTKLLHEELKAVRALNHRADDLFTGTAATEARGLEVVRQYVRSGREIQLADLFDLELRMTRSGVPVKVNLNRQVESEGTNKLLRLVLALTATRELIDASATERLAIFLDEVATLDDVNRPALAEFCAAEHFVPVFAAPTAVEGFDRWVFLDKTDGQLRLTPLSSQIE